MKIQTLIRQGKEMKKSIITIMLLIGLTNNIQAGSLLKPIIKLLVKGTTMIFTDSTKDNNQTKKEKKK